MTFSGTEGPIPIRTPNYNFERNEREKAKAAKKAEKAAAKAAKGDPQSSSRDDHETFPDNSSSSVS